VPGTLPPLFRHQFTDDNGTPLALGTVESYLAGTSTPTPLYSNIAMGATYDNPYTLPTSAKLSWYFDPTKSYKLLIKNASGTTIDTIDNIPAIPASASNQDIQGTAGETLLAGECCYLSDGSGSRTAGTWYRTDADQTYSSTTPVVAFAVSGISSGEVGTFRMTGVVASSGLTTGEDYYVSATAGAITSTAPSNARFVGVASSTTELVVVPTIPFALATLSVTGITVSGAITASGGQIAFPAIQNPSSNANTLDDYEEGSYTPAWTGGGAPAIGNGTLTARYIKVGKRVDVTLKLVAGGTTSFGDNSVAWSFSLPFAADNDTVAYVGLARGNDAGTASYIGIAQIDAGASTLTIAVPSSGNSWSQTNPFAWVSTDSIAIAITYTASA
jgi:hypothetical protein